MAMRLDADIRELAERMQSRRLAATKRVAAGEIMHLRFMGMEDCFERAQANLCQLIRVDEGPNPPLVVSRKTGDDALTALADAGTYGLAVIAKPAEGAA